MSSTLPTGAYDRYWAVAHTAGRSLASSMAATAAASPQPPKRKLAGLATPGVTGSRHRSGSAVASSPRNLWASTAQDPTDRAPAGPGRAAFCGEKSTAGGGLLSPEVRGG